MSKLIKPTDYRALLDLKQTELAIKKIKDFFLSSLSTELRLRRVTAPLFVLRGLGLNDDLSGIERPVSFPIKDMDEAVAEVVHSLAKWKRITLAEYEVDPGFGIITDMNAIRSDEELDNLHSLYVDQWDWERVMTDAQRNVAYLKKTVEKIYSAILRTEFYICETYPQLKPFLPEEIFFIHSEELRQMYPDLSAKEREHRICREHGVVFIIGIGNELGDGEPHDLRAPDYDDWSTPNEDGFTGLNGDLLIWYPILERSIELSSMGIRVNQEALQTQLKLQGKEDRSQLYFHKRLLEGSLPLSIGGGIGQSRLCMILLHKAHIGETQSSIWPCSMREECQAAGMHLI
ncbi:MAG: aspartate--ammonia ligase [Bacteroidaceae bacterium]|nr:aspartate--ammonia ligase [Bacteroidaceae bacterium]